MEYTALLSRLGTFHVWVLRGLRSIRRWVTGLTTWQFVPTLKVIGHAADVSHSKLYTHDIFPTNVSVPDTEALVELSHTNVTTEELRRLLGPQTSPLAYVAVKDPLTEVSEVTYPRLVANCPASRHAAAPAAHLVAGAWGSSEWHTLNTY